jgi:putative endonuclease
MVYFVYVLQNNNKKKKTTYVGYTNDLEKRIKLHNEGKGAKFTRGRKWKLIYSEKHINKKKALSREYDIKKNRNFRKLLKKNS